MPQSRPDRNFRKYFYWLGLYPLIGLCSLHLLMTGSPIPLWHIESLDSPIKVSKAKSDVLLLENGSSLKLPNINTIPHTNPLFQAAISEGIEVDPEGKVFGLLWMSQYCGNDPIKWRRLKVNLAELSGLLKPDGMSEEILPVSELNFFQERTDSLQSGRRGLKISVFDNIQMRQIRKLIEYRESNENQE